MVRRILANFSFANLNATDQLHAQGTTELIVFVPDEEGNPAPLFRAFGSVTAVRADGEPDGIPDFNGPAKKKVSALLNPEGRTLREVLSFMTPEVTEGVRNLLESVSETGAMRLAQDLDQLGISILPEEP